jgi:hypothetical protein
LEKALEEAIEVLEQYNFDVDKLDYYQQAIWGE